jgi:hypothetical protein
MSVRYHKRRGGINPDYVCEGLEGRRGGPRCQSVPGDGIDEAIGGLVVEVVEPQALEVALAVAQELESRAEEADRLRHRQVERARYEAEVARRRYMQVDPENRLVAEQLEAEWNESLRASRRAEEEYERARAQEREVVDEEKRKRVLALAGDFPRLWKDPETPDRERKRMVRLLIEDATIVKDGAITVHVRFKGGKTRSLELSRPLSSWEERATAPEVVGAIDRLLDDHTEGEVAEILNERGLRSGCGNRFDGRRVRVTRRAYGLRSRRERLCERGLLSLKEVSKRLGVSKWTVKEKRLAGKLQVGSVKLNDMGEYMYESPDRMKVRGP